MQYKPAPHNRKKDQATKEIIIIMKIVHKVHNKNTQNRQQAHRQNGIYTHKTDIKTLNRVKHHDYKIPNVTVESLYALTKWFSGLITKTSYDNDNHKIVTYSTS